MSKVFSKKELITHVAKATGKTKKEIECIFETTNNVVVDQLNLGKTVKTPMGQIKVITKKPRKGTNPKDGKPLNIPGCKRPKYIFNLQMHDKFNK